MVSANLMPKSKSILLALLKTHVLMNSGNKHELPLWIINVMCSFVSFCGQTAGSYATVLHTSKKHFIIMIASDSYLKYGKRCAVKYPRIDILLPGSTPETEQCYSNDRSAYYVHRSVHPCEKYIRLGHTSGKMAIHQMGSGETEFTDHPSSGF